MCLLALVCALLAPAASAQVWVIHIDGAIGPAAADHTIRSLERAVDADAEAVVLRIDTPGGLDSAMRDMIKAVLAAPLPVLGYVGPSGARAASAGTYLLYATHIAAMAPGTNLGAATPVQLGGGGLPELPGEGEEQDG
ncbi:MAG TPA: serine protease, partial [Halieaceae bacterium]|nr:serine protease [Halieaceae bacterium]